MRQSRGCLSRTMSRRALPASLIALSLAVIVAHAFQSPLASDPHIERYRRMARAIPSSVVSGRVEVAWLDQRRFEFTHDNRRFLYDVGTALATPLGNVDPPRPGAGAPQEGAPLRAPGGSREAYSRGGNVFVTAGTGNGAVAVTRDGNTSTRLRYGVPSALYQTELRETNALWWSPRGTALAFYRVDERDVPNAARSAGSTGGGAPLPYPTPRTSGPSVDLLVYHVASQRTVTLDVRDGRPRGDSGAGYYIYQPTWNGDGTEVWAFRMNRRQTVLDLCACSIETGRCRTVVRESASTGWVDREPVFRWVDDGRRFVWSSERTGFRNLYLYDPDGSLVQPLTRHTFDVSDVVQSVESSRSLFYMAHDGDNPMKLQLHAVQLDATADRRLTDPEFHHTISVAPDGQHFVDVAEAHDRPPVSRLMDAGGHQVAQLASSNRTAFDELGLRPVEAFTFTAADGQTILHGLLHRPSNFDPSVRYPLLVSAYAGPETSMVSEAFSLPNRLTELGFLVAMFQSRGATGRGIAFRSALYQQLGHIEVDDQAAGVRALAARPYVDSTRVGIFGTSYGGYTSVMSALRHPDVFTAAASSATVTDWPNYNSAYTERYLGLLADGAGSYDRADPVPLANQLRGRLLLFHGTADTNVLPSQTERLAQEFARLGKPVVVRMGAGVGHAGVDEDSMMAFFIEALARP